jgi:hypothetical protein
MNKIEIEIKDTTLATKIFKLIRYMEYMGNVGHSAVVEIKNEFYCFMDGDGSDKIQNLKINGKTEEEWMSLLLSKSIFTEEEKKYFLENGFTYNFHGADKNSFYFFDGDIRAYSYINIRKSKWENDKHPKYFINIFKQGKKLQLRNVGNCCDDFIDFDSFDEVKNYITPLFNSKLNKSKYGDYFSKEILFDNIKIKEI